MIKFEVESQLNVTKYKKGCKITIGKITKRSITTPKLNLKEKK